MWNGLHSGVKLGWESFRDSQWDEGWGNVSGCIISLFQDGKILTLQKRIWWTHPGGDPETLLIIVRTRLQIDYSGKNCELMSEWNENMIKMSDAPGVRDSKRKTARKRTISGTSWALKPAHKTESLSKFEFFQPVRRMRSRNGKRALWTLFKTANSHCAWDKRKINSQPRGVERFSPKKPKDKWLRIGSLSCILPLTWFQKEFSKF